MVQKAGTFCSGYPQHLYETLYPNRIIFLCLIKNVIVMTISSILRVFHVLLCLPSMEVSRLSDGKIPGGQQGTLSVH